MCVRWRQQESGKDLETGPGVCQSRWGSCGDLWGRTGRGGAGFEPFCPVRKLYVCYHFSLGLSFLTWQRSKGL